MNYFFLKERAVIQSNIYLILSLKKTWVKET